VAAVRGDVFSFRGNQTPERLPDQDHRPADDPADGSGPGSLCSQHFLNLTHLVLHFSDNCLRSAFDLQPATAGQDPRRFFECALDFRGLALESVFGAVFHTLSLGCTDVRAEEGVICTRYELMDHRQRDATRMMGTRVTFDFVIVGRASHRRLE